MTILCRRPESPKKAAKWQKTRRVRPLAHNVLAVATTRIEGAWKAYIGAVPGFNHELEKEEVFRQGTQLPEDVARCLFPDFDGPYAR